MHFLFGASLKDNSFAELSEEEKKMSSPERASYEAQKLREMLAALQEESDEE